MGVSEFGVAFLPLCLLAAVRPDRLLQLVLVGAAFQSAAVVTFGSYGVTPSEAPALLFVAFVVLQMLLGVGYAGRRATGRTIAPFVLVTVWALAGSLVLPRLFAGTVEVWPQKPLPPFGPEWLAPTAGNLTQDTYLVAACLLLWLGATYFSRPRLDPGRIVDAYLLGGFLVAAVSFWQCASRLAGVPFPEALLHSNPGWSQALDQNLGRVSRIGGPFTEPAALAGYMSGIVGATGWMIVRGHRGAALRVLLLLALATLAISTSTTGFVVLALLAVALPAYALLRGAGMLLARVAVVGAALATGLGVTALTVAATAPALGDAAGDVYDATFRKSDSESFALRSASDLGSLALLLPTYGLGVGWGSNRSSSLLPGTAASLGVVGLAGLAWFATGVIRLVRAARPLASLPADARAIDAASGALVACVVAALVSGPAITDLSFYLLLALLIGTAARVLRERRGA